jgi:flavin-dependent dehydrogenase
VQVLLVDRASFPRAKVCGSCLNGWALATLREAGLGDLPARYGAVSLTRVRLGVRGREAEVRLPEGMALSREQFDMALVKEAVVAGAHFLPQTTARHADSRPQGQQGRLSLRSVILRQGDREALIRARVLLGADGLSGRLLADKAGRRTDNGSRIGAGAVAPTGAAAFDAGRIHMACGTGGYVGLVRLEDGRLDVAAALDPWLVRREGGLDGAVRSLLHETGWPEAPALGDLSWRGTPPLTCEAQRVAGPGWFVLGDAAGYVEPFTGEGMAWALASAVAVAPLAQQAAKEWHPTLAGRWTARHRRLLGAHRRGCRLLTRLLRYPVLVRGAVAVLAQAPFLAVPLVRWLNQSPRLRGR